MFYDYNEVFFCNVKLNNLLALLFPDTPNSYIYRIKIVPLMSDLRMSSDLRQKWNK